MNDLSMLPINPSYEQLRGLEREILATMPAGDCPVTHHFADGVYCREMFIPKGTILTGKIHKFSTLNIMLKGDITVTTPEGMKRIQGPCLFVSVPGCKKAGFAHEDTVWLNVHPTRLKDVASIEQKFIQTEAPHLIEQEEPVMPNETRSLP